MQFLSVWLAANQPPQEAYWVMMGAAGVFIVYVMLLRPRMRRKDPLARSGASTLSQERHVEREMQHLLVELSEMSRQITSQLDTRAAKLDALIREADERIAQLRAAGNCEARVSAPSPAPAADIDPRHAEIYALADTGRDANQIAQQLHRPRGEVELILALRTNR